MDVWCPVEVIMQKNPQNHFGTQQNKREQTGRDCCHINVNIVCNISHEHLSKRKLCAR